MKDKIKEKFNRLSRKGKIGIIAGGVLLLTATIVTPVFAWFSSQRQLADMQYVDSPTELYITAGHGEDLKYLDLSGIKVTDTSVEKAYYVFGVKGSDASGYNLQLAYTTNNQFEYFIYPAKETQAASTNTLVTYSAHNDNGTTAGTYYYEIDTANITNSANYKIVTGAKVRGQSSTITAGFRNLKEGATASNGKLALQADETEHTRTYNYGNVQDYSEPLYWQATNIKSGMNPKTKELMDYYILEVNWKTIRDRVGANNLLNDRETDVVYIAVDSTTVN